MEFLDSSRLNKQRTEAAQILEILTDKPVLPKNLQSLVPFQRSWGSWQRHPAVLMWKGHEEWLKLYLACCIGEWNYRGYRNSIVPPGYDINSQMHPAWLGCEEFHESHRGNLIRKEPSHYVKFWPEDKPMQGYFWPTLNGFKVMSSEQTLRNIAV
jgi:hypothetical protein